MIPEYIVESEAGVWLLEPYTEKNLVVMSKDLESSTLDFSAFSLETFVNSL